jgi:hypothetical protein
MRKELQNYFNFFVKKLFIFPHEKTLKSLNGRTFINLEIEWKNMSHETHLIMSYKGPM